MNFVAVLRCLVVAGLSLAAAHSNAAEFPQVYNSEPPQAGAPTSPEQALKALKLPPGFSATLFAAEPDVQNPIALAWDARGRLWVAENYTYAERGKKFDLSLRDRILIFSDRDGDGHFDSRQVFTDQVQMLTSVQPGHGGVWVVAPPQLLFIPDRDGDDQPDGPAEVMLDGFTVPAENYHNFANGLHWGPDGWLYGRCGASSPGEVGVPGTPAKQRVPLRGGMWRFHPQRKTFEALTAGNTNPWGHDWDEHGQLFFINTVNGHLWHALPGAHFVRAHTIDPNPRAYALIDQHADHWHFDTSKAWSDSRDGVADSYGGGHSHIGMMIYLGDNWPAEYRNRLFTLNQHGRRANQEILERHGSGYRGRHGPDFFLSGDPWFRGLEISYGPDGGVFVLDWSDTGECHDNSGVHRTSGRIFKITHGKPAPSNHGDLAKLNSRELVKLQSHANEWYARQARLELAERAQAGRGLDSAKEQLRDMFTTASSSPLQVRALLALHAAGAADETFLRPQLRHANEHVRAWAVRLLTDQWPLDTVFGPLPASADSPLRERFAMAAKQAQSLRTELVRMARADPSALVRLTLASTLQRIPVALRAEVAAPLLARSEDAGDHNLPLMLWYGLIPVGESDPAALATLAAQCQIPRTREFIARRLGEGIESHPGPLNDLLQATAAKPAAFQADILKGLGDALTGWRKAKKPAAWDSLVAKLDPSLTDRARELSVVFGDGRALDSVKQVALDKTADLTTRRAALQTLIENRPPDLQAICEQLIGVRFLNTTAARGLAMFEDAAIAEKLARSYKNFHPSERASFIETLVSRPALARALLEEVSAGKIARGEITPFHARQIRSFNDASLSKRLSEVWGELRDSDAEKRQLISRLKGQLTPAQLSQSDKSQGRALFNVACASCHTLYGEGRPVGPDLTGAGRDNLDYLLENIADPSAVVTADFKMAVVNLKDGRVFNGVISARTDRTLTLQTLTEQLTVERSEVEKLEESALSLMPEGLLEGLNEQQVRDLIAYLMHSSQVPLK